MTKYNTYTLKNGLRVIHLPSVSQVVYCGYQIAAGTRNELPGEEGLAHFCEHLTFKGTERRNALQIINALEGVGGELNAFTNKEDTVFYAAISKEHFLRAVDVLTDIVFHSTYPQHEMDKEVEVVCDEIESYNDSPAELIYDEFENILFEGHPLGHNILGRADLLHSYTTADALRFVQRYYRPDNAVFFVYGDIDFKRLVRNLEKQEFREDGRQKERPAINESFKEEISETLTLEKDTHQAHVMLGTRSYPYEDPRRMTLYLLNNLLGGPGMNARLNLSLREHHGLVYTVESAMTSYSDTGAWSVYFGCDHNDIRRCLRLVRHELNRMMQKPLSDRQLAAAKRQLKGQIAIACDNHEQFALDFGRSFLHHGQERHLDALYRRIDAITADEIQQVACELFKPERLLTLIFK
ncbi:Predicted Zn-dependent peptidase [Xylanibacter ruminicola]|uniref:Predicted Zn-dependent peptidase n=1 Tax=Xylanibacter ruminicola TaxID=839 RepID=A0A1H5TDP1_XYLRU|nr:MULTISPECIES: pitrilysin family protein [Prevotellaceae]SEF60201.1 Predicted Zn-dependent peptidase [Xylanibacter ruminicola]SEV99430.1 Predicted Zn-dependent peptidase [Prevotella sp. khp7]